MGVRKAGSASEEGAEKRGTKGGGSCTASGHSWPRRRALRPCFSTPSHLLCLLHVHHACPPLLLLQPARLRHHVHVLHRLHHGHVHVPRAPGDDDLQNALLPSYHTAKNQPLPLYSSTRTQTTSASAVKYCHNSFLVCLP